MRGEDDPIGTGFQPGEAPLHEVDAAGHGREVNAFVGGPVGQVVSRMTKVRPAAEIVLNMVEEYMDTLQRMSAQYEQLMGD